MLRELAPNQLWTAEMPYRPGGLDLGARMTVVRLSDGGLFIHSPIELKQDLQRELDRLGSIACIVSPTRLHYMHLAEFANAYPEAKLYAPPGFQKEIPGVRFAGVLGDTPEPQWAADLRQLEFRGNKLDNEVVFLHPASRTLILADLCFYVPSDRSAATRVIARLLGVLDRLGPTRTFRLFMRDRQESRDCIQQILAWDFDRVIVSHGDIVESGGHARFRDGFAWLLK